MSIILKQHRFYTNLVESMLFFITLYPKLRKNPHESIYPYIFYNLLFYDFNIKYHLRPLTTYTFTKGHA